MAKPDSLGGALGGLHPSGPGPGHPVPRDAPHGAEVQEEAAAAGSRAKVGKWQGVIQIEIRSDPRIVIL